MCGVVDSPGRAFSAPDYEALCARFGAESAADSLIPTHADGVQTLLDLALYEPPHPPEWAKRQILEGLYPDQPKQKAAHVTEARVFARRCARTAIASRQVLSPSPRLTIRAPCAVVAPLER